MAKKKKKHSKKKGFPFPYPAIFALAHPRRNHQKADGISFTKDHFEGLREANTLWRWSWAEIQSLEFIWQKGKPGMWQMLLGSPFARYEDHFIVEHKGSFYRFPLEWDSKYRRQELATLFIYLYQKLPGFLEKNHQGSPVFLSESLPLDEVETQIARLRD